MTIAKEVSEIVLDLVDEKLIHWYSYPRGRELRCGSEFVGRVQLGSQGHSIFLRDMSILPAPDLRAGILEAYERFSESYFGKRGVVV